MKGYLFPFELVEKGSRIVIYGFGMVGRDYLLQLNKTRYCEVLYFVDRNYVAMQEESQCKVVSAETLYGESASNYDSVLIALDGRSILQSVKTMLTENGIPSERIITPEGPRLLSGNDLSATSHISEIGLLEGKNALEEYARERYALVAGLRKHSAEYYYPELSAVLTSRMDRTRLLGMLKKQIAKMPDQPYKLILLQLMYLKECFDAECFQLFVNTVAGLDQEPASQFSFFVDMDIMYGYYPHLLYSSYFTDRRKIMRSIAEKIQYIPKRAGEASSERVFRIAVLCCQYEYLKEKGNVTSAVRNSALILRQAGADIVVFSLNSIMEDDSQNVFLDRVWSLPLKPIVEDAQMRDANIDIRQFTHRDPYERMRAFTQSILEYGPDVVLDISSNHCPPIYVLHQLFPVIHSPTRLGGTSSFFDVYLTQDKEESLRRDRIHRSIPLDSVVEVKSSALPPEQERVVYQREDYGFTDTDFIIVTVGYRLGIDINETLLKAAVDLLVREPDIKWILVGQAMRKGLPEADRLIQEGRIVLWGMEDYLESFYQICDIYLQPNRIGGGMSVRQAMREGLPVAMLDFQSDARAWMSEDDVVHGDYSDLMEYIRRLYHDHVFYQERSARMKQIIEECTCENEGERLLAICKAAAEKYGPLKQGRG